MKSNLKIKPEIWVIPAALVSAAAIWQQLGMASHDFSLLIIFAGLVLLFRAGLSVTDTRSRIAAAVLGLLYSLFLVLSRLDIMEGRQSYGIWLLIRLAGYGMAFYALLVLAFSALKDREALVAGFSGYRVSRKSSLAVFFGAWAAYFAVFLVWLLYEFPGWLTPDSTLQLMQATGDAVLSDHHPVVHTMLIKLVYLWGLDIFGGNANNAVALYSALQALFMAMCFAYSVVTLYRLKVRRAAVLAVFLSYIVLPFHGSYSITMWKDVPFAGIVLLLCCSLLRILRPTGEGGRPARGDIAVFFLSSVGMCLFRSNGLYAYIFFAPFVIVAFVRKSRILASVPVLVLAAAFIVKGPVYSSLDIVPPDTIESLSVPAQHIARAVTDGAELSEEQRLLLEQVVDVSYIPQAYSSSISDPIKVLVRYCNNQEYIAEHKGAFLKLWLDLGLKNPGSYLKAQIDLTRSYWSPNISYWAKSYYTVPEGSGIYPDSKLPSGIAALISGWSNFSTHLPVAGLLFSIGAAVWLCLALFALTAVKKHYRMLVIFIPVLAIWLTLLIATPLDNEFRYAYSLFTNLPLLCVVPFIPEGKCDAPALQQAD